MGFIGPNFNQPHQTPQQAGQSSLSGAPGNTAYPSGGMPAGSPGPMVSLEALLAPLLAAQMALTPEQTALLLRNLLKMPREIIQLLAMLANTPQAQAGETINRQLMQLLLSTNPNFSLESLQTLMQQKTQDGTTKLLTMLQHQQAAMAGQGGKELGALLKQLSQMATQMNVSPTETLTQTLMLYLPWYPLEATAKLHLYFEPQDGEDEDESGTGETYNLILLLETLTMGRFKIIVGEKEQTRLLLRIGHDAAAQPYLADLQSAMIGELTGDNLPPPEIRWEERETVAVAEPSEASNPSGKIPEQSLGVHPLGGASVLVVNAGYMAARVILEADRRHAMLQGKA